MPREITDRGAALAYLAALERAHEVASLAFRRQAHAWWQTAGYQEQLAMLDLCCPADAPRCSDPQARAAAAHAHAELAARAAERRGAYVNARFDLPGDAA